MVPAYKMIPLEVLVLVAQYIEPDIVRYLQLATIDHNFYKVFTSDLQWVFLNPYGLREGIMSDFIRYTQSEPPEFCAAVRWITGSQNYTLLRSNKYIQLLGLVNSMESNVDDEKLAWCGVNIRGKCLGNLSERLRNNYDIVLAAVRQDGSALANVPLRLSSDIRVVTTALCTNFEAINYSNLNEVRNTAEFLRICEVLNPNSSLQYAYDTEHDILHLGLPSVDYAIMKASQNIRDNKEVVRAAIVQSPGALKYASSRLQHDRELMQFAVSKQPELIYNSNEFTDDFDIVLLSVSQRGNCLMWASSRLQDDEEIVKAAMANSPNSLRFASKRLQGKLSTLLYLSSWSLVGPVASSLYSVYPF